MKAISILQPWASLVAAGSKRFETRSWATTYRGPLAIHASARLPVESRNLCDIGFWAEAMGIERGAWQRLPLGSVVATCRLVECVSTDRVRLSRGDLEAFFGDFSAGRWAWRLEDVRRLPMPVPAMGRLGLWEWEPRGDGLRNGDHAPESRR